MICDMCGQEPCQTTTFCAESRRLDQDPAVIEARARTLFDALYPNRPPAATSTLRAADYLAKIRDPKRLRAFLKGRPDYEKAAILTRMTGKHHG